MKTDPVLLYILIPCLFSTGEGRVDEEDLVGSSGGVSVEEQREQEQETEQGHWKKKEHVF
ncbi:hypothetical protein DPMN_125760 [Dreissena polymorpha]|uniref:Uncharacterized protein n=1 Tax=Dreissena polymorpha TaxID=45954 RepID=A0A9D4GYC0_DREPO|nr:hypothetical protein DPMN_125760 [Dreissena polymorpha]